MLRSMNSTATLPSDPEPEPDLAPAPEPAVYFSRHLRFADAKGTTYRVDEAGLLEVKGAKVALGEPGMGKSELIDELGRRLGVEPVSAVRFLLSKNPANLIEPGKPLLIDGLDEAMARREGDAVDAVLAQLEEAGSPDFVLSCRAREWQSRGETNLRRLYGADPTIFTLEPLSRDEARAFLIARHPNADPIHVIDHLDRHGIADLYSNPLTLGLMGRVAETDAQLPASRGALFERVCALTWPEHDPDRQDEGLAQLTQDEALSAAGAISAAMLLAGAEAASTAGAAQVQDGDLRIAAVTVLPAAAAARTIFSSKLFQSVATNRAKPIHRVIAEFLGARWLAGLATSPRTQRRMLAQLQGSGGVPASLRGLHAWLAYHSPAMAERVIAADPYGVLRYGETAALSPSQVDRLFEAMCRLAEDDPFFRASDWDSRTAAGLIVPHLRGRIDAVIGSASSNAHLRSLLIEGLRDTPLAVDLAGTLEEVMLSPERFYREREEAAEALRPHRDPAWWQGAIETLRAQGDADATRLAHNLVVMLDGAVSDDLLVGILFAELGATISPLPRDRCRRPRTVRHYHDIAEILAPERLRSVLDLLAEYAPLLNGIDRLDRNDFAELISVLIVRSIDAGVVGPDDGAALWRWLSLVDHAQYFHRKVKQQLVARLDANPELRHAAQDHGLYEVRRGDSIWVAEVDLQRRLIGLSTHRGDATWFLSRMADGDNKDETLRGDWRDLMRIAHNVEGFEEGAREQGERFARGDRQLATFIDRLENPGVPQWQRRRERQERQRERKERVQREWHRREFAAMRGELCAGALGAIIDPAKAYLGIFRELEGSGGDAIVDWLGPELAADAMAGLEAVLHRSDLPSPREIAQGFAEDATYNYGYAIMAGLLQRHRSGQGFSGIAVDVLTAGLLLCHHDRGWCENDDMSSLQAALEAILVPTPAARQAFARLLIEPVLAAGRSHVTGLHMLANEEAWQAAGGVLADQWLIAFPDVPESVEVELVDCLTHAGELHKLAQVAAARATTVYRSFDHLLTWLAIDVLVRFEAVRPSIGTLAAECPEFIWFLRNRLQLERRGRLLPLSVVQAQWVISQFRSLWAYAVLQGSGSGSTNPYDATDFLRALINRIADDTSEEASDALQALIAGPEDSYSELIRHMAAEQRQKRAEEAFTPIGPSQLAALLADGPPGNADDLKSLVLEELAVAQKKLLGEDIDQVVDFWSDSGIPRNENRCRDRLAAMIGPDLMRYDVQRITEADMPMTKRADLAYARGQLQLPMEVKGQWHKDVWSAADGQLDLQYLIDWRSDQRGIYCVLWFGDLPAKSKRRLRARPGGAPAPMTPAQMREMLIEGIPEARRALIDVVVLDLTAGKL